MPSVVNSMRTVSKDCYIVEPIMLNIYLAHAGMLSRRKLPLVLGLGCKVLFLRFDRNEAREGSKVESLDPGIGGRAVKLSSLSFMMRMVEPLKSLERRITLNGAGISGSFDVFLEIE